MIKVQNFTRKQPDSSDDYSRAYKLVNSLGIGESELTEYDNIKVFRKYIYDLSYKQDKEFATRIKGSLIAVSRLS